MTINFASRNQDLPLPRADAAGTRAVSPVQAFYLDRLTRLVHKILLHGRYLATTDRRMQLLNRAVLATFRSCRDLGVEAEARAILDGLRRQLRLSAPAAAELPGVGTSAARANPANAANAADDANGSPDQLRLESQPG